MVHVHLTTRPVQIYLSCHIFSWILLGKTLGCEIKGKFINYSSLSIFLKLSQEVQTKASLLEISFIHGQILNANSKFS